ncbi:MAG: energy transducer TonB [Pseudomonadota bacterium]|nr:energy transducer TonB [Pseudomonadota bacterium]
MTTLELDSDSLGSTQDRFGFTMFMSICVHVMLILGLGFTMTSERQQPQTLEVTLAQYRSAEAPEDADFIAQANQEGSGSEDEALAPASPVEAPLTADTIQDVDAFVQERPAALLPAERIIATEGTTPQPQAAEMPAPAPPTTTNGTAQNTANDTLASLRAQLDLRRQEYAKRPRRYTISSASTKESYDALYLDNWRKRIEAIGNLNYPRAASEQGIYGALRVMVALNPDGTVNDIRILRSSGERVLDEAAVDIVRLAAPFDPFPPELRANVDVLEIIRTWQFDRGDTFSSF